MSGAEWAGVIASGTAALGAVGKGISWVVTNLILKQPLATIEQQARALAEMTKDRDFWRDRALGSDDKEATE